MSNKLDFSKELIGRRALVTGGTRGIGAAIAQRLLDAGAKVVVTARSRGDALPAGATFVAGDVATVQGVKAIAAGALGALGGLDIRAVVDDDELVRRARDEDAPDRRGPAPGAAAPSIPVLDAATISAEVAT